MKVTIDSTFKKRFTCVVTDELLRSVESAAEACGLTKADNISMTCQNGRFYEFDSIEELVGVASVEALKPVGLHLRYSDGVSYSVTRNMFELVFGLRLGFSSKRVEARYCFSDEAKYLLFKEKIDALLMNSKASYSFMTHFPIAAVLLTVILIALHPITWAYSIVFPQWLQTLIYIIWFAGSALSCVLYVESEQHRAFPFVDFRIGQMKAVGDRRDALRHAIAWSVVVAFVVGVFGSLAAMAIASGVSSP